MDIVASGTYFRDESGEVFWRPEPFNGCPLPEPVPVRQAKPVLVRECLLRLNSHPGTLLRRALDVMAALALDAPRVVLANRFAAVGESVFVDLDDSRAVEVKANNWAVVSRPTGLFRRYSHQRPLPVPVPGGDPWGLFEFLPPLDKPYDLICLTWLVLAFHPGFPRPMLVVSGPQGSGKSTLARLIKEVSDPSQVLLLGEDARGDLSQAFSQHGVPVFDNLTRLSARESDLFCRAVTGGGVSRRKLYTDAGEFFYTFRRPMVLTAIGVPSTRHDFLDRSIVLPVRRLPSHRPERGAAEAFGSARPAILGGLFNVLAGAMAAIASVDPPGGHRMADFSHWGRAVALALGRDPREFDAAYRAVVQSQADAVCEDDPLAQAVLRYMADKEVVPDITREALFAALEEQDVGRRGGVNWRDVSRVSGHLEFLGPTLELCGVRVTKLRPLNTQRSRWRLERVARQADTAGGDKTGPRPVEATGDAVTRETPQTPVPRHEEGGRR